MKIAAAIKDPVAYELFVQLCKDNAAIAKSLREMIANEIASKD